MKYYIIIAIMLFTSILFAQEVKIAPSKPFIFATYELAIGKGIQTSKYINDPKLGKLFLFIGSSGGYYYITKNSKGEIIRKYVKIEQ